MEDAFEVAEENFVLLPDFVNAAVVHVEVIDHAIYDSGELVIPGMVVEDKTFNLALSRCLHDLRIMNSSPVLVIVECEVGSEVKSEVKLNSKFIRCSRV